MPFVRLVHPASYPLDGLDATLGLCSSIEYMTKSLVGHFDVVFKRLEQRLELIRLRVVLLENQLRELPSQSDKVVTLPHPAVCPWKTTIDNWAPSVAPLSDFTQSLDGCETESRPKDKSSYASPVEEFDLQKALDRISVRLSLPVPYLKEVRKNEDMVQLEYLSDLFIFNSTKTRYEKRYADSPSVLVAPAWLSKRPDSQTCRFRRSNDSLLVSEPSTSSHVVSQANSRESEIPELNLPESLPQLAGIASFPEETSGNSVKEELVQSKEVVIESNSSCTVAKRSSVPFEEKSLEPAMPAPPAPPPPVVASNSAPLPLATPSRTDLMASIREAGGVERFQFKSRQPIQTHNSRSAGPVCDLKTAMEKRRKEIMGRQSADGPSSESTAEALLRSLSANVRSNGLTVSDGENSSKSTSDEEWSN